MYRPDIIKKPVIASVEAVQSIARPQLSTTLNSMPITVYNKNSEPVGVANVIVPDEGLFAIMYLDKVYVLRNSIYIETDIVKVY